MTFTINEKVDKMFFVESSSQKWKGPKGPQELLLCIYLYCSLWAAASAAGGLEVGCGERAADVSWLPSISLHCTATPLYYYSSISSTSLHSHPTTAVLTVLACTQPPLYHHSSSIASAPRLESTGQPTSSIAPSSSPSLDHRNQHHQHYSIAPKSSPPLLSLSWLDNGHPGGAQT